MYASINYGPSLVHIDCRLLSVAIFWNKAGFLLTGRLRTEFSRIQDVSYDLIYVMNATGAPFTNMD